MKLCLETLDRLRVVKDCPEIDDRAAAVNVPLWHSAPRPDGVLPPNFQCYRRYNRTGEQHEGVPVFREVEETGRCRA